MTEWVSGRKAKSNFTLRMWFCVCAFPLSLNNWLPMPQSSHRDSVWETYRRLRAQKRARFDTAYRGPSSGPERYIFGYMTSARDNVSTGKWVPRRERERERLAAIIRWNSDSIHLYENVVWIELKNWNWYQAKWRRTQVSCRRAQVTFEGSLS